MTKILNQVVTNITSILVVVAVIIVIVNVISRYFFNYSLVWSVELTRYIFTWLTFLGSALALAEGKHLVMDAFSSRLTQKFKQIIDLSHLVLSIFFLSFLFYYGLEVVKITSGAFSPSLQINMSYVYMALPVGTAIMLCFLFDLLVKKISTIGGN